MVKGGQLNIPGAELMSTLFLDSSEHFQFTVI